MSRGSPNESASNLGRPADLNSLSLPDLFRELSRDGLVRRLLELARDEDVGPAAGARSGDVTSAAGLDGSARGRALLAARSIGRAAGLAVVPMVIDAFGAACTFTPALRDGDEFAAGAVLGELDGRWSDVLTIERTVLNLLGRLCGVATRTATFVAAMGSSGSAKLYDTRKTTPGLRRLEKYAVRCGGGFGHRLGLYDAVLLKDNHLAGVSVDRLGRHVADAARSARANSPRPLRFVEVEADTLDQLKSILLVQRSAPADESVDIVLLDNMTPDALREGARIRAQTCPRVELEASGGVTLESVAEIARTGVERVSTGSITHGATWLDIGLDAVSNSAAKP